MTPEERMNAPTPKTFLGAIGEIDFVIPRGEINFVIVEVAETAEQRARRIWRMEEPGDE